METLAEAGPGGMAIYYVNGLDWVIRYLEANASVALHNHTAFGHCLDVANISWSRWVEVVENSDSNEPNLGDP